MLMRQMGLRFDVPCMSPEHFMFCLDPDALEASGKTLEAWEFESLVICHGRILEGEMARAAVRDAFAATVKAARARGRMSRALWHFVSRLV
jgi:hypothetical protein